MVRSLARAVVAASAFLLFFACFAFLLFSYESLLVVWALWFFCVFDAMCRGFLMIFAGRPPLVIICVFIGSFVFVMLCAWFFDGSSR